MFKQKTRVRDGAPEVLRRRDVGGSDPSASRAMTFRRQLSILLNRNRFLSFSLSLSLTQVL